MQFVPKFNAFLSAIKVMPNVSRAAEAAGMSRAAHYAKLHESPEYRKAFEEAVRVGCDAVSDVAIERAMLGWEEPLVYKGQLSYPMTIDGAGNEVPDYTKPPLSVRKIDNGLLQFVLSRRHPEYSEKKDEQEAPQAIGKVIYEWVPRKKDEDPGNSSPAAPPA